MDIFLNQLNGIKTNIYLNGNKRIEQTGKSYRYLYLKNDKNIEKCIELKNVDFKYQIENKTSNCVTASPIFVTEYNNQIVIFDILYTCAEQNGFRISYYDLSGNILFQKNYQLGLPVSFGYEKNNFNMNIWKLVYENKRNIVFNICEKLDFSIYDFIVYGKKINMSYTFNMKNDLLEIKFLYKYQNYGTKTDENLVKFNLNDKRFEI